MEKQSLRIFCCTPLPGFGHVLEQALGPGFEIASRKELCWPGPDRGHAWDVLLLDLQDPRDGFGLEDALRFLEQPSGGQFPLPVVAILGAEDRATSLRLMELGVLFPLLTPPDMVELRLALRQAHQFHRLEREAHQARVEERTVVPYSVVGVSGEMRSLFELAQKVAPCDVTVLIMGETGTGKELWARAIHRMSARAEQPFVGFSCANLPETLIEDELFGHEKGAFTGATSVRRGRFETADHGTLFLDEIGDLSLNLQPKLLRVIQERSFERLGGSQSVSVDIRMIAATHQDLSAMVAQGRFREDLFYRLNVVQLYLPPLRERRQDVPELAHFLLKKFATQFDKKVKRFSRFSLQAIEEYAWPGNVREMENVIQRAVVVSEGPTVELRHLPNQLRKGFSEAPVERSYEAEVREFKRRLLLRTLHQCGWRKTEAARTLGMARNYLHRLINQLQITPDQEGADSLPEEPRQHLPSKIM